MQIRQCGQDMLWSSDLSSPAAFPWIQERHPESSVRDSWRDACWEAEFLLQKGMAASSRASGVFLALRAAQLLRRPSLTGGNKSSAYDSSTQGLRLSGQSSTWTHHPLLCTALPSLMCPWKGMRKGASAFVASIQVASQLIILLVPCPGLLQLATGHYKSAKQKPKDLNTTPLHCHSGANFLCCTGEWWDFKAPVLDHRNKTREDSGQRAGPRAATKWAKECGMRQALGCMGTTNTQMLGCQAMFKAVLQLVLIEIIGKGRGLSVWARSGGLLWPSLIHLYYDATQFCLRLQTDS